MKTILLKSDSIGRYDDVSPFIITDGKLEIRFELPAYNGEFFFIAENNGRKFKQVMPQDRTVTLDGLTAGELNTEVKHYVKGALVKSYKIEPLVLRELDGSLSGTPEFTEIRREIGVLKETLAKANQAAEERERELKTKEAKLKTNLHALFKFACKDYRYNVYLSGGDMKQFIEEFGFELSDEELKELSGGEGDD